MSNVFLFELPELFSYQDSTSLLRKVSRTHLQLLRGTGLIFITNILVVSLRRFRKTEVLQSHSGQEGCHLRAGVKFLVLKHFGILRYRLKDHHTWLFYTVNP